MCAEDTCRRKFAKAMANHVLTHEHFVEGFAVVNQESVVDELGHDHGAAAPSLDRALVTALGGFQNLLHEMLVVERAFFNGASHYFFLRWTMNLLEGLLLARVR